MKWLFLLTTFLSVIILFNLFQNSKSIAENVSSKTLTLQNQTDLKRVKNYLESIKTLKGNFLQIDSNGFTKSGKVFIARPGRLRFEYDPPDPILLIADGFYLIYIDKDLEQVSHVFLKNTPVSFLLKEHIQFKDEITVTNVERSPGVLQITVTKTDEPESGSITLLFSDNPILLKKWKVIDAQSVETTVNFSGLQTGIKLDPDLFIYTTIKKEAP